MDLQLSVYRFQTIQFRRDPNPLALVLPALFYSAIRDAEIGFF
jgi:hypothetical protein